MSAYILLPFNVHILHFFSNMAIIIIVIKTIIHEANTCMLSS